MTFGIGKIQVRQMCAKEREKRIGRIKPNQWSLFPIENGNEFWLLYDMNEDTQYDCKLAFCRLYRPFNWHTFYIINGQSDNISVMDTTHKKEEKKKTK